MKREIKINAALAPIFPIFIQISILT